MDVPIWLPAAPKLAVVGQSVGPDEARRGRPFIGPAGQQLREWLRVVGLDPDEDVLYTNICQHFNPHDPNHKPTVACMKAGSERVRAELAATTVRCALLVGGPASHLCFKGRMGEMHGRQGELSVGGGVPVSLPGKPAREPGEDGGSNPPTSTIPTLAMWHPSFYIRSRSYKKRAEIEGDVMAVLRRVVEVLEGKRPEVELPKAEYVGEVVVR